VNSPAYESDIPYPEFELSTKKMRAQVAPVVTPQPAPKQPTSRRIFRKEIPPEPPAPQESAKPKRNYPAIPVAIGILCVMFIGYEVGMWIIANLHAIENALMVIGLLAVILWIKFSPKTKAKK